MRRRRWLLPLFCVASSASFWAWNAAAPQAADKPAKPAAADPQAVTESQFLRVLRDKAGTPTAMQTAVVRYEGRGGKYDGVTVDLIGAVHVGERSYYQKLNELFADYEAMLYELVAPKDTKIPKGGRGRSAHPVGMLQHGMSDALGLVHQMNEVDYTKKNFVHADMTPDEFDESMEKRGESWIGMMFQAMGQGIAAQANNKGSSPELEMLAALFDKNPEVRLKRAFASQFDDLEGVTGAFGGPDGSTIITERNKKALEVLEKQLAAGKKHVAIFYGAAHLPDMHQRLLADFGLKPGATTWLTAWDMSDAATKKADAAKPAAADKPATKIDRSTRKSSARKKKPQAE